MAIIAKKITPESIVYADQWPSYNAQNFAGFCYHRINHFTHYANGKSHINGIENFWNQVKIILRKYNGIPKESFLLFLKECEFRFNYGSTN